jgi:hypothetical protein
MSKWRILDTPSVQDRGGRKLAIHACVKQVEEVDRVS